MVILRLQRIGKKKEPHFRLIAQEKSKDPHDKSLEILGFVNPRNKERRIKKDKIEKWLSNGAQCTNTVYNLLIDEGIIKGEKRKNFKISKKRLNKKEGKKEEKPAEGEKKEKDETPAEDKKDEVKKEKKEETKPEEKSKEEPKKEEVKTEEKKK